MLEIVLVIAAGSIIIPGSISYMATLIGNKIKQKKANVNMTTTSTPKPEPKPSKKAVLVKERALMKKTLEKRFQELESANEKMEAIIANKIAVIKSANPLSADEEKELEQLIRNSWNEVYEVLKNKINQSLEEVNNAKTIEELQSIIIPKEIDLGTLGKVINSKNLNKEIDNLLSKFKNNRRFDSIENDVSDLKVRNKQIEGKINSLEKQMTEAARTQSITTAELHKLNDNLRSLDRGIYSTLQDLDSAIIDKMEKMKEELAIMYEKKFNALITEFKSTGRVVPLVNNLDELLSNPPKKISPKCCKASMTILSKIKASQKLSQTNSKEIQKLVEKIGELEEKIEALSTQTEMLSKQDEKLANRINNRVTVAKVKELLKNLNQSYDETKIRQIIDEVIGEKKISIDTSDEALISSLAEEVVKKLQITTTKPTNQ